MNTMNRRDLLKGLSAAGAVAAVAPVAFEPERVVRVSSDVGSGGLPDGIKNNVVYRAIDGSLMAGTYE
jgi:hypothetical protein